MRTLMLALALLVAGPVMAAPDEVTASAKRYFASGSKHFDLGEYSDALADFKEGYRLKDDPVFLYNIAQCQRLLNQNVEAVRTYKAYLRRQPDAANRVEVERKITALEEAQRSQEKATTAPPNHLLSPDVRSAPTGETTARPNAATMTPDNAVATTEPAPARTPLYKKWWLWTAVGALLVGAAVGTGVGVAASRPSSSTIYPAVQF